MTDQFIGTKIQRVDAREKVRGRPLYGADRNPPRVVHAALKVATIGKGRITGIDATVAEALPGVLLVITHLNMERLKPTKFQYAGGLSASSFQPMQAADILYRGQPIAMVIAETPEIAAEAIALLSPTYDAVTPVTSMHDPACTTHEQAKAIEMLKDVHVGDPDAAFANAAVKLDETYTTPAQHHNPMELLSTVASWDGDRLTIHEGTQAAGAVQNGVAEQLGTAPENIRVLSPFVGGAFGQRGGLIYHTVLAAVAARRVARPVKLVIPRPQQFTVAIYRTPTEHRLRVGATSEGRLVAGIHEMRTQSSRSDLMPFWGMETSGSMYDWQNVRTAVTIAQLDTQTPGDMRAPMEMSTCFALESAIDELAHRLGKDPIALRNANDTGKDPVTGKPFSLRKLAECMETGASRFGWSRRDPRPGSMRGTDGTLIGWGMAAGAYPGMMTAATATIRLKADGTAELWFSGHEMGQGIKSVAAIVAGESLGIDPLKIQLTSGDTTAPPQQATGGSWGTASAAQAIRKSADDLRDRIHAMASAGRREFADTRAADFRLNAGRLERPGGPSESIADLLRGRGLNEVVGTAGTIAPGQKPEALTHARKGQSDYLGPVFPDFVSFQYAAHFVEVRVDPFTPRPRVARMLSIIDCGRVMSRRTALSQGYGGQIWGIGAALAEAGETDARYGGFLNNNLAEYHIPVNADVRQLEVDFIDEPDFTYSPIGCKGLGEIVCCGVAAAVANAVHHATGRRIRNLPIRIEDLMA